MRGELLFLVPHGPGALIAEIHRDRLVDVQQEDQQQADLDHRNQRIALERVRVLVERCRPEEDDQIAEDVDDEVDEKGEAGDADEDLRRDG